MHHSKQNGVSRLIDDWHKIVWLIYPHVMFYQYIFLTRLREYKQRNLGVWYEPDIIVVAWHMHLERRTYMPFSSRF